MHPRPFFPTPPQAPPRIWAWSCPDKKRQVDSDRLMLKVALTYGFFGFLRGSEYTLTNRDSDITWVKDGVHFFIKKSKTDQVGRGTTIAMDHTHRASCPVVALQAYFIHCKAPPGSSLFHFQRGRPLTSRAMRAL